MTPTSESIKDHRKNVIVTVTCANDFASGTPVLFAITLTQALVARIRELSTIVKQVNARSIEEFFDHGLWSSFDVNTDTNDGESMTVDALIERLASDKSRVEIPMLHVTDNDFYFTAIPHSFGDSMALTTSSIPLSALENNQCFLQLNEDATLEIPISGDSSYSNQESQYAN